MTIVTEFIKPTMEDAYTEDETKKKLDLKEKFIMLLIKLYRLKEKPFCTIFGYIFVNFLILFPIISLIIIFNDGSVLPYQSRSNDCVVARKEIMDLRNKLMELYENHNKLSELIEYNNKPTKLIKNHIHNSSSSNGECIRVSINLRFDCHPENGASELACYNRGCCWAPINKLDRIVESVPLNVPYCFYPKNWKLYEYESNTQIDNDFSGFLINKKPSFYKKDVHLLKMESISIDEDTLQVKIFDSTESRYEPKWPIRKKHDPFKGKVKNSYYKFEIDKSKPGFRIRRSNKENSVIFDSLSAGGFIFSDQFLQMSAMLPSHNIYGLGEHRTSLKLNTNWQILTMFNKDQPPVEHANLYGSHPFYLVVEESGDCFGVLFLNSNAMDVVLQPSPALTFRSLGGIFDMYFFMGPTPSDVLSQYSKIVGKPFMPPYWSLGFHLCRFGYGSLAKTKEVWNRTRAAGIPFDTQWNDLDYMENNNDFTYNKDKFKDLPKFIEELHAAGMHYIPLIDPGISASEKNGSYPPFEEGMKNDIFIKNSDTNLPFIGKVWNRVSTVWPDFTHPRVEEYWYNMMNSMHKNFQYDGAWIDMNEPSNFYNGLVNGCSSSSTFDNPPYMPNVVGGYLATKTLCMNAKHSLGWHYDIHNTYAIAEAAATNLALTKIRNKRPFIVSRATWVGQGFYSAHWTGDIYSSWYDMKMSIPEILAYSFFQIPMVGADICGFDGNTTKDLCNRWMQVGAFYPFSRNHNSDDTVEQDPVAMGDIVVKSSRKALMIRYRFLPYLYTLFYRAHIYGETVARPLFFEFTTDKNTLNIDSQFLWGKAFMIVPVLEQDKEEVVAYIPSGVWYDFYNKSWIFSGGKNFTLPAPIDTIPILIRGGFILPAQTPGKTTTESRKKIFELLVAPDVRGEAIGELYWDDGDSLDSIEKKQFQWMTFKLTNQTLYSTLMQNSFNEPMILGKIQIMGVQRNVTEVIINKKNVEFNHDLKRSYLTITSIQVNLKEKFTMMWK